MISLLPTGTVYAESTDFAGVTGVLSLEKVYTAYLVAQNGKELQIRFLKGIPSHTTFVFAEYDTNRQMLSSCFVDRAELIAAPETVTFTLAQAPTKSVRMFLLNARNEPDAKSVVLIK